MTDNKTVYDKLDDIEDETDKPIVSLAMLPQEEKQHWTIDSLGHFMSRSNAAMNRNIRVINNNFQSVEHSFYLSKISGVSAIIVVFVIFGILFFVPTATYEVGWTMVAIQAFISLSFICFIWCRLEIHSCCVSTDTKKKWADQLAALQVVEAVVAVSFMSIWFAMIYKNIDSKQRKTKNTIAFLICSAIAFISIVVNSCIAYAQKKELMKVINAAMDRDIQIMEAKGKAEEKQNDQHNVSPKKDKLSLAYGTESSKTNNTINAQPRELSPKSVDGAAFVGDDNEELCHDIGDDKANKSSEVIAGIAQTVSKDDTKEQQPKKKQDTQ